MICACLKNEPRKPSQRLARSVRGAFGQPAYTYWRDFATSKARAYKPARFCQCAFGVNSLDFIASSVAGLAFAPALLYTALPHRVRYCLSAVPRISQPAPQITMPSTSIAR